MYDVSPKPLSGLLPGTAGTHLDLFVLICLRSGSYRIVCVVSVSSSISCYIIWKTTIAIKHRLSNSSTLIFVRTANAYPLPVLCLKIDLFSMISQLLKAAGWKTGACMAVTAALACEEPSRLHPHTHTDAHNLRASHSGCRWWLVRAQDKRPLCTPSVKQGIGLIDMQAAPLLQSRGGSFAVERAGRQLAGATVWQPYVHYTPTSFQPHAVLGEDNIRHTINMQQLSMCNRLSRRAGNIK